MRKLLCRRWTGLARQGDFRMRALRLATVAAAVLCGMVLPISGQEKALALPTNEQLRHYRSIGEPRLSPDGRSVLVLIADATAEGGKSHVWLVDVAGGAPRQLTYSPESEKGGERDAEWMPDGRSVLFVAHRGEHTLLYRLPMQGGEAKSFDLKVMPAVDRSKAEGAIPPAKPEERAAEAKAEPVAVDVAGYRVSPDGVTIAVLIEDPQTAGEKRQKDAKADAAWVDHDPHGTRLYLLDTATGKLAVTAVPPDVRRCAWSADGKQLAAVTEGQNGEAELHPAMRAWMLDVADAAHVTELKDLPATIQAVAWSRDGQRLVFRAQASQDAPPGVSDLYEYSVARKTTTDRSEGYAGTLGYGDPIPLRDGEVDQVAEAGVDTVLLRYTEGQARPQVMRLPVSSMMLAGTNAKESGWVYLGSDGGHAPGLYFAAQRTETPRLLTLPGLVPEGTTAIAPRRVRWKSDGFAIEGLLYLPPQAAGGKVPLVVEVHGGPTGVFSDRYDPFAQFLLGHGWAVLRPNPRGSTGYGAAFAAANRNDLGGGDFRDIMAGVDFVLRTEPVDAGRMALLGYSYGGEMAGFAEGKTDRFKAIVSAAPVIDQFSEYGTEKGSWYDRWFYGLPWDHAEAAWRQSPLAGVGHAKTPFLLLQGESDTTDPLGQSQEMYRALRQAGVPVDLVTYPREDHGPLAMGIYGGSSTEPWHGFDARQRIAAFFEAKLK